MVMVEQAGGLRGGHVVDHTTCYRNGHCVWAAYSSVPLEPAPFLLYEFPTCLNATADVVSELPAHANATPEFIHKLLGNLKHLAGPVMPMEEMTKPPTCFDMAHVANANLSVLCVCLVWSAVLISFATRSALGVFCSTLLALSNALVDFSPICSTMGVFRLICGGPLFRCEGLKLHWGGYLHHPGHLSKVLGVKLYVKGGGQERRGWGCERTRCEQCCQGWIQHTKGFFLLAGKKQHCLWCWQSPPAGPNMKT